MFKLAALMLGAVGTLMSPTPTNLITPPGSGFAILLEDGNKLTTEDGSPLRTE